MLDMPDLNSGGILEYRDTLESSPPRPVVDEGCSAPSEGGDRLKDTPVRDVAIVGGGILGMTLALRLQNEGIRVTLIEAAPVTGGLTQSQTIGGFTWDRFYHVILRSDLHLQALLQELGLTHLLRWATTRTGFYIEGDLHSLSDTMDFVRFPPLSASDKIRLAATILYASRIRNWQRLERISVTDWLCRLSGERTFKRVWLPLLRSKLGENYRQTSAAFIWAIIARMYAARRSGLKREMFGYVQGGYSTILQAFRTRLERLRVRTLAGRPVTGVGNLADRVEVRLAGGGTYCFDRVVLTVPCGQVLALCPELSDPERERLTSVVYQGIVCASLLLRKPLADFYITNITDSRVPFTGVIEMSALVDPAVFGGNALVYLPRYLTQSDPIWQKTDADIRETFVAALERMYPGFDRRDVLAFQVARVREMLAVSTLHYSERSRPPLRTSLPNVFVVNSAQIANGTLNVNETVALANSSAEELRHLFAEAAGSPVRRP
ncbi:MAG TPA: NAD(P)/FAD-dependent oxidoreductase [Gemmatimonadales bacterium]|nr:NAD(P)/FAD-dependent oxidoreductase [Gemmatimonadales bacterium]